MDVLLSLAADTVLSPMVLFFALGFAAALARSDLAMPEAAARAIALYLMLAIGFKGGAEVAAHGADVSLAAALAAGVGLSLAIPLAAFALLRLTTRLGPVDAAAVAGHYGSVSIVTFVAAAEVLKLRGIPYEGYLVAVMAIMESPAIVVALWLARRYGGASARAGGDVLREIALNGSVVLLVGAFAIGWITGPKGLAAIAPFVVDPFKGVLCLFLLDMGLVAARGFRAGRGRLAPALVGFGCAMPLIGAALASGPAYLLGLSPGGAALLLTLAASASYIAVPAAMRLALPAASPATYLTLSLGVTFPFNLTLGIPVYIALAGLLAGGR